VASYFHRLAELGASRFWVNNPTPSQTEQAVSAGAVACTTNPTYGWKQLGDRETRDEVERFIREGIASGADDHEVADYVQRRCVERILPFFESIHSASSGTLGFVSLQGNPLNDDKAATIVEESHRYRELGAQVIAKVPVTRAGLEAMERLVADDIPVIATEVMALSQALAAAEMYKRVSRETGNRPPFFLTHITGIFDDYLREELETTGTEIQRDIVWNAGIILARRQYQVLRDRGHEDIIMLGGGARGIHHFTELVGEQVHVTINWSPTALDLINSDPPVVFRMETSVPAFMIDELREKIPTFDKAYRESGLTVDEFETFGPVRHFRSMFCDAWEKLVATVAERRS